jgi:hypothetical protein
MLPYSTESLFALFEQYNLDYTLFLVLGALLALEILIVLGWRDTLDTLSSFTIPLWGISWIWIGIAYYMQQLSNLYFAASYYGWMFVIQGALMLGFGLMRSRALKMSTDGGNRILGWSLLLLATLAYPLWDYSMTWGWPALRVVGSAPEPTLLFTIGLILLYRNLPAYLIVIPILASLLTLYQSMALYLYRDGLLIGLALIFLLLSQFMKRNLSDD